MDFKGCSKDYLDPLIVVEENKRKFTIHNPGKKPVKRVKVDGCLIKDKRQRCDYLFEIGRVCHCVIYLELKGKDIEHAFNQLVSTLEQLKSRHRGLTKICHIVASRVSLKGPKFQNLYRQMVQKHKARLYVDTKEVKVNIEREPYNTSA